MQLECWATCRICIKIWCSDHFMHRLLDLFYRPLHTSINNLWGIGNASTKFVRWLPVTRFTLLWFCVKKKKRQQHSLCALLSQSIFLTRSQLLQNILKNGGVYLIFPLWLSLFNFVSSSFALMPNKIKFSSTVC